MRAAIAKWPQVWILETREAFYVVPLDPETHRCPASSQPVYRLYNSRNGPNRRYVTDVVIRERMANLDWTLEGDQRGCSGLLRERLTRVVSIVR